VSAKPQSATEDLLDAIIAPRSFAKDDGSIFVQRISSEPATKTDVVRLQESLDQLLQQRQARETGICPIREALYSEATGAHSCLRILNSAAITVIVLIVLALTAAPHLPPTTTTNTPPLVKMRSSAMSPSALRSAVCCCFVYAMSSVWSSNHIKRCMKAALHLECASR
jgi:hypothetical protein